MGSGTSHISEEQYLQDHGVHSLVKEAGLQVIPSYLRHSYLSFLQIKDIFYALRQFDRGSYNGFLFMLLALVRHAQNQTAVSVSCDKVGDKEMRMYPFSCSAIFERDRIYARYAVDMYAASWEITRYKDLATSLEIDEDDIVMKWLEDDMEDHCPKFVVFVDRWEHSVVLVIRGSLCVKDVIMNTVCDDEPFLDGFAHKGFLDGSKKILLKARHALKKSLHDNPGFNLVLVGHSMGGGTAELITLNLLMSPGQSLLPPGVGVRCVSLGPPPVFRGEVPQEVQDKISIYINNMDFVSRFSLGTAAKLLAMLRAVDNLSLRIWQQLAVLMWTNGEQVEMDRKKVVDAVKSVRQETFPYLDHPGHVIRLTNSSSGVRIRKESDKEVTEIASNMEIFETMVTDHIHITYRDIFKKHVLLY